jgi:sulfur carrier protein ThiS
MKLHLGDYFTFFINGTPRQLEVPLSGPCQLRKILFDLEIPLGEISLIVVNGKLVELENAIVSNEDEIKLYPPMDGG